MAWSDRHAATRIWQRNFACMLRWRPTTPGVEAFRPPT
jgi:hypothetical protein